MTTVSEQRLGGTEQIKPKKSLKHRPTMQQVDAIILGGGRGTRLLPLTLTRSKPGICFGGYYRLIDVAISNAINSLCHKVSVITQFFSTSLHHHIYRTYQQNFFSHGRIQLLPAEERPSHQGWFSGTADAVRQNMGYLTESHADYFLILSGDQLYTLNFQKMLEAAYTTNADLTVAATPVDAESATRMGILQINEDKKIVNFVEKPEHPSQFPGFTIPQQFCKKSTRSSPHYLASMGIYLFKREALIDLLAQDHREDFGKHLIPTKVAEGKASAYLYDGYWEDIGTIPSFHKANIALTQGSPFFNYYDEKWPILCRHNNLPGPKVSKTSLNNVIMCEGSIINAKEVSNSILGPRTIIKNNAVICDTYIMGNDFYVPPKHSKLSKELSIGENTVISGAIIDKHASIGKNVQLTNKQNFLNFDSDNVYIRDGIIVVPRGAIVPNGYIL